MWPLGRVLLIPTKQNPYDTVEVHLVRIQVVSNVPLYGLIRKFQPLKKGAILVAFNENTLRDLLRVPAVLNDPV